MLLSANIKHIKLKSGYNDKIILQSVKFNLMPGKVYTILGKNGSGKSTLIKSLTSLLNPNLYLISGSVLWKNENILSMPAERLLNLRKKEIRYVFQDLTNSFDPLKKISYYFRNLNFTGEDISEHLKSYLLPEYRIISDLHPYELSGGMAQRLSILFAFLPDPDLIIFDEPTSAIDYKNINLVKLKINDFTARNKTALIVTQDIEFAKIISDEVSQLVDGRLNDFQNTESFFSKSLFSKNLTVDSDE